MHNLINYRVDGHIAIIELNKPPVNAMDQSFIEGLIAALGVAGDDPQVRAVIITSAVDNMFCGGIDLELSAGAGSEDFRQLIEKLYLDLYDAQQGIGKPTIAALNGAARGGGMTISASCDIIVAEQQVTLGYPEVKVGLMAAIHFVHLPRHIGRYKAFELLMTGDPIGADEAERLGLVNKVVPKGQLMEQALLLANKFAAISPTVMQHARSAFLSANDRDYRNDIAKVVDAICALAETEAAQEGLHAFIEKRKPDW